MGFHVRVPFGYPSISNQNLKAVRSDGQIIQGPQLVQGLLDRCPHQLCTCLSDRDRQFPPVLFPLCRGEARPSLSLYTKRRRMDPTRKQGLCTKNEVECFYPLQNG